MEKGYAKGVIFTGASFLGYIVKNITTTTTHTPACPAPQFFFSVSVFNFLHDVLQSHQIDAFFLLTIKNGKGTNATFPLIY